MSQTKEKPSGLQAHRKMQALMDTYYRSLRQAKAEGKKIGWATGQAPTDILAAMDIIPAYPENHAAICGTRRVGTQLCQIAEGHDYSPDLCSYARNCLGSCFLEDENFPVQPLPEPDILIAVTMCNTHVKWWEALGKHFNVPILMLETPFVHDELSEDDIKIGVKYATEQLKEMTTFLGGFCHRPYNFDRLQESIANSSKAGKLYAEFVHMTRHIPSPVTSFDHFLDLAPMMCLRGFPEAVGYYEVLLDEVRERIKNKVSAVGEEKYRIYWDNIPVWYRVGWFARKLADYNACTVAGTYPWAWINGFAMLDPERPLESIAESQVNYYQNRGTKSRIEFLLRLVKEFSVDGLLAQASFSCKAFVPDQAVIIREAQKLAGGLPAAQFQGDMIDERLFSEDQVTRQLDDFMNVLATRVKRG